ncbi:MAG: helix-turn-helix domain-containing protein [Gammaproteobacteria bacterium]
MGTGHNADETIPRDSASGPYASLNEEELLQFFLSLPGKQRNELFVNTAGAAGTTGLSQRTIQSWIEAGSIQAVRVGKKYQIYRQSLLDHLQRKASAA